MRQRLIPKPARRAKLGILQRHRDLLRGHESTITAVSVLISSIGLVIAAASAWVAWRQVEILAADRNVPFKAAIYQERVNLMRDTTRAMARYEEAANCVRSVTAGEEILGPSIDSRRKCRDDLDASFREVTLNIRRSIAIWPPRSRAALGEYLVRGVDVSWCATRDMFPEGMAIVGEAESIRMLSNKVDCRASEQHRELSLQNARSMAEHAMMEDINALASEGM